MVLQLISWTLYLALHFNQINTCTFSADRISKNKQGTTLIPREIYISTWVRLYSYWHLSLYIWEITKTMFQGNITWKGNKHQISCEYRYVCVLLHKCMYAHMWHICTNAYMWISMWMKEYKPTCPWGSQSDFPTLLSPLTSTLVLTQFSSLNLNQVISARLTVRSRNHSVSSVLEW